MCADELLTECIIALGNLSFLIYPRSSATGGYNGNLVRAVRSSENVCVLTDYVFCFKCGNKGLLKGVGNKEATFGIRTDLKCVADFIRVTLSCVVPEGLFVVIGSSADLGFHLGSFGLLDDGSAYGLGHLHIHSLKALHTCDFLAEFGDVILHTSVGCVVLGRENALVVSVGVKERFCGLPCFCTLGAKFVDSHNNKILRFF